MDITDAAHELMLREHERDCQKQWNCSSDELPPMAPWEERIRKDAVDATHSASYQKGRPTFRQRQKIETYNKVARRYRALAAAELDIITREIQIKIQKERIDGDYVEPELNGDKNVAVIFIGVMCAIISTVVVGVAPETWPVVLSVSSFITVCFYLILWNKRRDDPRIAKAKHKYRIVVNFWEIAT